MWDVRRVQTQITDPRTGMLKGDKVPGLGAVIDPPGDHAGPSQPWQPEEVAAALNFLGYEAATGDAEWIISALKGKGKGKGKGGKNKGKCFNRGEEEHYAR